MDCRTTLIIVLGLLIGSTFCKPEGAPAPLVATEAGVLPIYARPQTGIVGAFDNIGAGLANFGNTRSGYNAILSGSFNSMGTLFSGLFGSGAVNTAFLNYNNRPPVDPSARALSPAAGGAAAGLANNNAGSDPPADGDSR